MRPFEHEPRHIIDGALDRLAEVTTLQDLAATRDGILVDCLVNGSTIVRFSMTGTEPFVDQTMHIDIDVPGSGSFRFDAEWLYNLAAQAGCGP